MKRMMVLLGLFAASPGFGQNFDEWFDDVPDLRDRLALEAFVDGLVSGLLEAHHVAGAAVAVVQNGDTLLAKGYGLADVDAGTPVSGEETLFRIGSVSKLFVWTAVMQLVEQGRIDLHADVNTYLPDDVQVPGKFDAPVTMTHLLTHTAGFEDHIIGLFTEDEADLRPLGEILDDELPKRVNPPGESASYSNYGTGLAMYVVEQITGVPWETYLRENIIEPLGMEHTTFAQPFPEALEPSKGYRWNGKFNEEPFELVPLAPVGAAGSTAADMARFMIAHLQYGRLGDTQILQESIAREMQRPLFGRNPALNAMAHGFYEQNTNGFRVIGHGGDTFWFRTQLSLIPEENAGVFVSTNTNTGGVLRHDFLEAFFNRYFPAQPSGETTGAPPEPTPDLSEYAGDYRSNRHSRTTVAKLGVVTPLTVYARDGALHIFGSDEGPFHPAGDDIFRAKDPDVAIAFLRNEDGEITELLMNAAPTVAFDRVEGVDSPLVQGIALAVCLGLFVFTVVWWPLVGVMRWYYDAVSPRRDRFPFLARFFAWGASALFIAFAVSLVLFMESGPRQVGVGDTSGIATILGINHLGIIFAVISMIYLIYVWREGRGKLFGRVYYTLLCAAFIVFIALAAYWRLVGYWY